MFKLKEAMRSNGLYTLLIDDIDEVDGKQKVIGTYRVARVFDFHTKQSEVSIMDYFNNYNTDRELAENIKQQLIKILEFIEGGFSDEFSGLH